MYLVNIISLNYKDNFVLSRLYQTSFPNSLDMLQFFAKSEIRYNYYPPYKKPALVSIDLVSFLKFTWYFWYGINYTV